MIRITLLSLAFGLAFAASAQQQRGEADDAQSKAAPSKASTPQERAEARAKRLPEAKAAAKDSAAGERDASPAVDASKYTHKERQEALAQRRAKVAEQNRTGQIPRVSEGSTGK